MGAVQTDVDIGELVTQLTLEEKVAIVPSSCLLESNKSTIDLPLSWTKLLGDRAYSETQYTLTQSIYCLLYKY